MADVPRAERSDDLRQLLGKMFEGEEAGRLFTVLRNAERLPEGMSGTDLDVSVNAGVSVGEVVAFLRRQGEALGWYAVGVSQRPHMTGFGLVKPTGPVGSSALHFDVFDGISYLGLPLLRPESIEGESVVRDGVRQLSDRGRVLVTTVHHLAWNRALLKEKYRTELAGVLADERDRPWLLERVSRALGAPAAAALDRVATAPGRGAETLRRWTLWSGLASRWLLPHPLLALRSVIRYLAGQLQSFRDPPGLIGRPGDAVPGASGAVLDLALACRIAPHAAAAPSARSPVSAVRTLNGPRYERTSAALWRAWTPVRWVAPSLFLYVQAKRNRIVVLDTLPPAIRWLRASPRPPGWIAASATSRGAVSVAGILAGLMDTGLSSLATFAAGFFAARMLGAGDLGTYALVFSAFVVASMVPAQGVFVPAEVAGLASTPLERLASLPRTVRQGVPLALLAAFGMMGWVVVAPSGASRDVLVALTLSAAITTFVSPIQDHLRRVLHLAHRSRDAAVVSAIHVSVVLAVLAAWSTLREGPAWVPFGALATANVVSLAAGMGIARRRIGAAPPVTRPVRELLRAGRWLLAIGLLPTGAGFVAAVIVSHLAGVAALGHAEAARILTQPLFVLATGLSAFLGPRSMEAGRARHRGDARRISQVFFALALVTGIPYLLLTGIAWPSSPLPRLIPAAYVLPGLVAVTAVAMIVQGLVFPARSELLGAGRERALTTVEGVGNLIRLVVAGLAGLVGAYAIPAGLIALGVARALGYARSLRGHYREAP